MEDKQQGGVPVEKSVKCPNCGKEQKVLVAVPEGFSAARSVGVTCNNAECRTKFEVMP
jgi:hypothetical protein